MEHADTSEHDSHNIHPPPAGETAVMVPARSASTHALKALCDRASAEWVEEAEIDAAIAEHEGVEGDRGGRAGSRTGVHGFFF